MSTYIHKFLLVMVALSLAAAPLRATWAMPASVNTDTAAHCEQIHIDAQATDLSTAGHMQEASSIMDKSYGGCCGDDNCNNMDCNACAHGVTAITSRLTVLQDAPAPLLNALLVHSNSKRSVAPLLRPPTSL